MDSPLEVPRFDSEHSQVARVFPLPNVVLFPHVLLPLHIFESRYIEMVEDALADDGLIALAQLKPGWELGSRAQPEIFPVLCVGHIAHHVRLPEGRYNLILQGTSRARVISELPLERSYRQARVEILQEVNDDRDATQQDTTRAELLRGFRRLFPKLEVEHELHRVFESDIPLGVLCDVFAYSLQLDSAIAQQLLSEPSVERRSRMLLSLMERELTGKTPDIPREFPPPFSLN